MNPCVSFYIKYYNCFWKLLLFFPEIQLLFFEFPWAIFIVLVLAFQICINLLPERTVSCPSRQPFYCRLAPGTLAIMYIFPFRECFSLSFWCPELHCSDFSKRDQRSSPEGAPTAWLHLLKTHRLCSVILARCNTASCSAPRGGVRVSLGRRMVTWGFLLSWQIADKNKYRWSVWCDLTMQKMSKWDIPVSRTSALLPLLWVNFSVFRCPWERPCQCRAEFLFRWEIVAWFEDTRGSQQLPFSAKWGRVSFVFHVSEREIFLKCSFKMFFCSSLRCPKVQCTVNFFSPLIL